MENRGESKEHREEKEKEEREKNRCKWEERKKNKSYILGMSDGEEMVFIMDTKYTVTFHFWKATVHFVSKIGDREWI